MVEKNQQTPIVSVCVPSYNHARFIQPCIESIFAQTYQNIQLIIIDDGSTDNSPEIIEKTLKNCPFESKLTIRSNKGLVRTLHEGLEMARGDYFAVLASDDMWLPGFLEHRVNQLQNRPNAVLAYGHCYLIDENNKIFTSTADWAEYEDGDARNMLLTKKNGLFAPTVLYRKSALEKQKWNPDIFGEDYELYLRLTLLGEFAFESSIFSAYRIHSTNTSRDTEALISTKMHAFELNAESLGLTAKELKDIKLRLNWETSERYFSSGQRLKAIKAALQYSHIQIPLIAKLRHFAKLLVPNFVLKVRHQKIKRYRSAWYGIDVRDLIAEQSQTTKHRYNLQE